MRRTMLFITAALALLLVAAGGAGARIDKPEKPDKADKSLINVQLLALNDFHGQLEVVNPIASSGGRIGGLQGTAPNQTCNPPTCIPAGGGEYLATHVRNLRAENENTLFVSAGDLIGATPLLSALFHDEPTIEAFNLMGLDYNGVGNHEFDEGVDELLRMQYGNKHRPLPDEDGNKQKKLKDGCHPVDGCGDGTPFKGADFDFLAANVAYKDSGETIFAPYKIHKFKGGGKIAIVGMTLEGTPTIVTPDGIRMVDFLDEAETVNALVPELKKKGVEAIVVLLHEGGETPGQGVGSPATINSCVNPTGAIPPIVAAMDPEIDVVVTGHTNWAVNCMLSGKLVTGAASQGRLVTKIDLVLDTKTNEIVSKVADNRIVTQDVDKAGDITDLMAHYNAFAGPIAARVIGQTTGPITRAATPAGESALGDVIADAQLANTTGAGAVIAFMNPGGIRADIGTTGDLTYGQAFAVQPFSNIVVTMSLSGAQIEQVLEEQFINPNNGALRTNLQLQVSNGFSYTWNGAGPVGDRVDPATIKLNDVTLSPMVLYRVTVNSFLATGGDGFPTLNAGTNRVFGDDDLVALEKYFQANSPVAPGPRNRISRVN